MGAIAAAAAIALIAGGTAMKSNEASKKLRSIREAEDMWLPKPSGEYTRDFFSEMMGFAPQAEDLADRVGESDMDRALKLREKALPGIGKAAGSAMEAIAPFLRGELPPSVLRAFQSAGGASTVGMGMGGSQFGFLNQGLFGARGSLGAMQQGFSLLPALMSTLPNVNSPSTAAFLQAIMTPAQRTTSALQLRQQQIGLRGIQAGSPTAAGEIGSGMSQVGGLLLGGAMGGGGGMGIPSFGGGGSATYDISADGTGSVRPY